MNHFDLQFKGQVHCNSFVVPIFYILGIPTSLNMTFVCAITFLKGH